MHSTTRRLFFAGTGALALTLAVSPVCAQKSRTGGPVRDRKDHFKVFGDRPGDAPDPVAIGTCFLHPR